MRIYKSPTSIYQVLGQVLSKHNTEYNEVSKKEITKYSLKIQLKVFSFNSTCKYLEEIKTADSFESGSTIEYDEYPEHIEKQLNLAIENWALQIVNFGEPEMAQITHEQKLGPWTVLNFLNNKFRYGLIGKLMEGIFMPYWKTIYAIDRRYGGPEEGGWWWNCFTPIRSFKVNSEADEQRADKIVDHYTRGLKQGDIYSVLGGLDVQSYSELVRRENATTRRPYYE